MKSRALCGRGTSKYWLRTATLSVDVLVGIGRRGSSWPKWPSIMEFVDDEEADARPRSEARLIQCMKPFDVSADDDSASAMTGGLGDARPDEDEAERESERGGWKNVRTLCTTERERFGTASLA